MGNLVRKVSQMLSGFCLLGIYVPCNVLHGMLVALINVEALNQSSSISLIEGLDA